MPANPQRRREGDSVGVNRLLRVLVDGTSNATGQDFFRSLTVHLAAALGVRCAFAAELLEGEPGRASILSICVDGRPRDPFDYPVAGTPCEETLRRGRHLVRTGLASQCGQCNAILGAPAESYFGVRLLSAAGEALGVLGVFHDRRLPSRKHAEAIVDIFAARAAVEIERLRAERALRRDMARRAEVEEGLRRRTELEALVTRLSTRFITLPPEGIDAGIQEALGRIGRFVGVDRTFVFLFSDDGARLRNTHEWCARGVRPHIEHVRDLPAEKLPALAQRIRALRMVQVSRVDALAPSWRAERRRFGRHGVRSILCAPLAYREQALGLVGMTSEREVRAWTDECLTLLRLTGEVIANALVRKRAEEARQRSEARLRTLVGNAPIALLTTDASGVCTFADGKVFERVGMAPETLVGRPYVEALASRPDSRRHIERALSGEAVAALERFGDLVLEVRYVPVRDARGDTTDVLGVALDVTERQQTLDALRASEERLRTVIGNAPVVLFAVDRAGIFTLSEGKGLEALGLKPGEVVGRSAFDLYRDAPQVCENLRRALAGEAVTDVVRVNGLFFETSYRPTRDAEGALTGVVGVATDITERMRAAEALREQARRDPLTGVLNHAAITEALGDLVRRAGGRERVAVILADVDGMKAANDAYGHPVGDAVLRTAAAAMQTGRAIVGRYGGDEFVVLLPGADRAAAERYCRKVARALQRAHVTDGDSGAVIPVTLATGIAVYPEEAETPDDLVRLADSAMYSAKRQRTVGRGTAVGGRPLAGDRAARMVGEIVPLLTSPGRLEDKLRLVSHRLSVGAGYDAVNFALVGRPASPTVAANTFARSPQDLVEAWNRTQRENTEVHPVRELLERTRRPIVFDDPQNDERILPDQRALLKAAKLRSAIAVPMLWENQLIGILAVASKRERAFGPRDAQFLLAVATQVTAIVRMATLVEQLQSTSARLEQSQAETVLMLAAAAEARDHVTGLHLQNIRALTEALALELGYAEKDARVLGLAAVLHDIGKIRVPDAVLSGSSPLTDEDWELMKQHTVWGSELLGGRAGFELAAAVARSHHERWDGSGYPDGLAGDAIPEAAAIVAVADAFDAMTSDRPYRAALTVDEAIAEIAACSGRQFSPRVAEAMLRLHRRRALPAARRRARAA